MTTTLAAPFTTVGDTTASPAPTGTTTLRTTLITLDVEHPVTRAVLLDAHQGHKLTMSPFAHLLESYDFYTGIRGGHREHRKDLNILWASSGRSDGTLMIRLQSDVEPRFTNADCDWWRDAMTEGLAPVTRNWKVPVEGRIDYQIRLMPLTRVRGQRRTISDPGKQLAWWEQRAADAGMQLLGEPRFDQPIELKTPGKVNTTKAGEKVLGGFSMATVRVTGSAVITDPDAHAAALREGIGRGASYGVGLLLTRASKRT